MTAVTVIAIVLFALFVIWWTKYRYPPLNIPQTLCYHKLSEEFCFEGTWMPPTRFLDQIDHLQERGYRFINEDEFIRAVANPEPANAARVFLTFDDGYDSLHTIYTRELERRHVPMHVFLLSDYVGRENEWDLSLGRRPFRHLGWEEIRDLSDRGVTFGSHGASHNDLTRMSPTSLVHEIEASKQSIEAHLQKPVRSFSYPFGRYNDYVRAAVATAGYQVAFSLYPPHSNENVDFFALRRNGVYIIDTTFTIHCKLTRNPLFWFEEMKCRAINQVAVLTPMFKRSSAGPGK